MRLLPRINAAITFRSRPVDLSIFNYPKWQSQIPIDVDEIEFNAAWLEVFGAPFINCQVEYGEQCLMGNRLGTGLIVNTPYKTVMSGSFVGYTDDPILGPEQTFFYSGCGCTWANDLIGQRFHLIDPSTNLPVDWVEAYAWEVIKRYQPFIDMIKKKH